jgi:hypothetical protein
MSKELQTGEEPIGLSALQKLHSDLAKELSKMVRGGQVVMDEKGMPVVISPTPAVLNVVRQFLKDNNIQAHLDNNEDLQDLESALPFHDEPQHEHKQKAN